MRTGVANVELYQLLKRLTWVPLILAFWVPLQPLVEIAKALAGRQTNVTVTFLANLTVSIVLGGAAFVYWLKSRRQGTEIRRLRGRTAELEGKILELEEAPGKRKKP